ncbi:nucleotidyltransferase family protein [Gilvimarinus agarilyticus]|uniref:N-acetylmuramate alpha-1-phosphate uridylyltransferase MurU n=1 Tax=Gilvimarinus sp. 2_MG-2023 TaxID=3062666 RepID=UPI001C09E744|nr:nucleotidyltransferase family protein [Gilvimarinus sp. 2_MG-2023]MBU2887590.1 nucleotidyltransferase family protein [Gilvimarinus agarilyticus]MDO6572241.1 nucleotidyltransferase family protein [Gilvimarinus sp. 2_MG-2023]
MKAMILAAGLGKRMRPLTDTLPKPLIPVRGKPLIEWHLERLADARISEVLINISYLGDKIRQALGDGSRWGLQITYSEESEPLETGGAIRYAAHWLGDEPFLLVNADVFTQFDFATLTRRGLPASELGHLVLVPNPEFKPRGDFDLIDGKLAIMTGGSPGYTFAGISVLRPALITDYPQARSVFGLAEVFRSALTDRQLGAELYTGHWSDVGTPSRLEEIENHREL